MGEALTAFKCTYTLLAKYNCLISPCGSGARTSRKYSPELRNVDGKRVHQLQQRLLSLISPGWRARQREWLSAVSALPTKRTKGKAQRDVNVCTKFPQYWSEFHYIIIMQQQLPRVSAFSQWHTPRGYAIVCARKQHLMWSSSCAAPPVWECVSRAEMQVIPALHAWLFERAPTTPRVHEMKRERVEFNNSSLYARLLQSSSSAIKDTYSSPTADALGIILNILQFCLFLHIAY